MCPREGKQEKKEKGHNKEQAQKYHKRRNYIQRKGEKTHP